MIVPTRFTFGSEVMIKKGLVYMEGSVENINVTYYQDKEPTVVYRVRTLDGKVSSVNEDEMRVVI